MSVENLNPITNIFHLPEFYMRRLKMRITDVMTREFPRLKAADTIRQAVSCLKDSKLDAIPVVDREQRLVGYFTRSRLYNGLLNGASLDDPVSQLMVREVISLRFDDDYKNVMDVVRSSPVSSAPVLDKDGRVIGLFTKLDGVRSLFKESDRMSGELQAIFNAMHSGLITVSSDGLVTHVNASASRVLNLTGQELIGKSINSFWPGLGIKDTASMTTPRIGIKQVVNGAPLVVNITPIWAKDAVFGVTIAFQDLTELERVARELETVKELHETLSTILEIAYNGIVVVNEEGMVTLVNRPFAEFISRPVKEILGRHITDIFENTRLHIVAKTGVPETSDVQVIHNTHFIVSRLPIIKESRVVGAVGKIYFANARETEELAHKLGSLKKKVEYYRDELNKVRGIESNFDEIITSSDNVEMIKKEARQLAPTSCTILLRGESGTGKELFAQAIHAASKRRSQPFIRVNCAAIPENLLESELFGYAPGAFTGAAQKGKPGRFELASGGTLFLDEIGDMPLALQAKILRAIETRQFERVGGTETIKVDVRIISATNKDLEKAVKQGTFREDLYYRLNVVELWVPSLRERKSDLELLVSHFIHRFNSMFGTQVTGVTPEAQRLLSNYNWPGNVRELENAIERGVHLAVQGRLGVEHLPRHINGARLALLESPAKLDSYRQKKELSDREILVNTLQKVKGNKSEAAKLLGISRSTLYEKMRRVGLS